ncbi:MAG TPA: hypothetical protein VMF90_08690 [Rhizobiaceae bacterium]|nr:hypothetical protein [Rhizobiaceae bacterium]
MKNVTVSMDEDLARRARVAAARMGKSVSRYVGEATLEKVEADEAGQAREIRNVQLEALERVWSGQMWDVTTDGRMPTAEERNARR